MPTNVQLSFQFMTEFFSLMISQSLWSNYLVRVPLQSTTLRIKQSEHVIWGDASDAKSNASKDTIILPLFFIIYVLNSQNMLMAIIYDLKFNGIRSSVRSLLPFSFHILQLLVQNSFWRGSVQIIFLDCLFVWWLISS